MKFSSDLRLHFVSGPARRREPPVPRGGSLHRAPDGRRCTVQTARTQLLNPQDVQQLWSRIRQLQFPRNWDGIEPEGTQVIYWTEPIEVVCGQCFRASLGTYVGYEVGPERGIVEDTTRTYYSTISFPQGPPTGDPHARRERRNPRYRLEGTIVGRANSTTVVFTCRRDHIFKLKMNRLGRKFQESNTGIFQLG